MVPVVNANETVAEILTKWPRAARVLIDHGMHCVGCAIAPFETLTEACAIYDVPVESLLGELTRPDASEEPSDRFSA